MNTQCNQHLLSVNLCYRLMIRYLIVFHVEIYIGKVVVFVLQIICCNNFRFKSSRIKITDKTIHLLLISPTIFLIFVLSAFIALERKIELENNCLVNVT